MVQVDIICVKSLALEDLFYLALEDLFYLF